MNTVHLSKLDDTLARVARAAFPSYHGKTFKLRAADSIDVRSYWDGGSRDYFTFVRLADYQPLAMPAQSAFDRPIQGADAAPIPSGIVCVEHSIFCGKDMGLTFHVNPADMTAAMLPPAINLSWAETVVLYAARSFKSSYAGMSREQMTRRETGITSAEYQGARDALTARGMLNKAGAITPDGRNAVGALYAFPKREVRS